MPLPEALTLAGAFALVGVLLLALALAEQAVRRLPLTPALVYLATGLAVGGLYDAHATRLPLPSVDVDVLRVGSELAVLVSLFAVGLRLRIRPTWSDWRVALLLAGPAMVVAVLAGSVAAVALLALPWGAAVVLAAILAPTDPVLASEVQIRSEDDRDAVRLSLTAEGGLNDGAALPAVMLGLGLLGLHSLDGGDGPGWWWRDLLWPIGGGAIVGALLGHGLGLLLRQRARRGDPLARDEFIYVGAVALSYAAALATHTSAFVVAFVAAVVLLLPMRADHFCGSEAPLAARLHAFGTSVERLVEAGAVLAVGLVLASRRPGLLDLAFALAIVGIVRPLSVWAVVRRGTMSAAQRRLVAWFGIRGLGSLYYLAFALSHGLAAPLARSLVDATLLAVAVSIVLHGLSATTLMEAYHRRRGLPDKERPPC